MAFAAAGIRPGPFSKQRLIIPRFEKGANNWEIEIETGDGRALLDAGREIASSLTLLAMTGGGGSR